MEPQGFLSPPSKRRRTEDGMHAPEVVSSTFAAATKPPMIESPSGGSTVAPSEFSAEDNRDDVDSHHPARESPQAEQACSSNAAASLATAVAEVRQPKLAIIPTLLLVKLQQEDAQLVATALDELYWYLAGDKKDNRKHRIDANEIGAGSIVIMAMRKWQHSRKIQFLGMANLLWLTLNELGVVATVKAGGVEAIVSAIRLFPERKDLIDFGGKVLLNILSRGHNRLDLKQAALQSFLIDHDGLRLLQRAMRKFAEEADIQSICCSLLYFIVKMVKSFQKKMVQEGVVMEVASALKNHPSNEKVQAHGGKLMKSLFV